MEERVDVFFGSTGERATLDDVLSAIEGADVVVMGELHGHPLGLDWNAEVFRRSLERQPGVALCLEFLTRESQYLVDAYLEGLLDWTAFEEACEGIPATRPSAHRPMLDAARRAGAPVIAANAPRIYTTAARVHGYERLAGLSSEQARLFDVPGQPLGGAYRQAFRDLMIEHQGEDQSAEGARFEERFEAAFRAQSLWDATMAHSVSRTFEAGHRPVFLVVGSFHCNDEGGTVQRVEETSPQARVLVMTFVAEDSEVLLEEHRGIADVVAYVGPRDE